MLLKAGFKHKPRIRTAIWGLELMLILGQLSYTTVQAHVNPYKSRFGRIIRSPRRLT